MPTTTEHVGQDEPVLCSFIASRGQGRIMLDATREVFLSDQGQRGIPPPPAQSLAPCGCNGTASWQAHRDVL